jgi:CheY-like chemotaxis protein
MSAPALPRVLVVDDHPLNTRLVQIVLSRAGFEAFMSYSAASALEFLRNNAVDVVITDIAMPEMGGVELLGKIHEIFGDARPRVIAYTAYALEHEQQAIAAAGFDDLLVKPASPQQILTAVRSGARHRSPFSPAST